MSHSYNCITNHDCDSIYNLMILIMIWSPPQYSESITNLIHIDTSLVQSLQYSHYWSRGKAFVGEISKLASKIPLVGLNYET